ncbi:MAG: C25 family cysteine peptidase [Anaerolineae bacterium]
MAALVAALLLAGLGFLSGAEAEAKGPFSVLGATEQELLLRFDLPSYEIRRLDTGELLIYVAEAALGSRAGEPQVPRFGTLVALPYQATATIEVVEAKTEEVVLDGPPAIVQGQSVEIGPADAGTGIPVTTVTASRTDVATGDGWWPAQVVSIGEPAYLRDLRVADLRVIPFQYNATARRLRVYARLTIRIRFNGALAPVDELRKLDASSERKPPSDNVIESLVINYEQAQKWRGIPEMLLRPAGVPAAIVQEDLAFKLYVSQDGLYQVTYDELAAAGFPVDTVDPRRFALSVQGQPVAITVLGEEDGSFDSGDAIVFYGQRFRGDKLDELYTDQNVYWLTLQDAPLRMEVVSAPPATAPVPTAFRYVQHAEEDHVFWGLNTTTPPEKDPWFWRNFRVGATGGYTTMQTVLPGVSGAVHTAVVTVSMWSYTTGQHDVSFYMNEEPSPFSTQTWTGRAWKQFTATVSSSELVSGVNSLKVNQAVANAWLLPNWYEIEYDRLYVAYQDAIAFRADSQGTWRFHVSGFSGPNVTILDITDPINPSRIDGVLAGAEGGSYYVEFEINAGPTTRFFAAGPGAVRSPDEIEAFEPSPVLVDGYQADYVVITTPELSAQAERLADLHRAEGMTAVVLDFETLCDTFNWGIYNPKAIRMFLSWAFDHWQSPAPSYVVLFGDGHYDFKGHWRDTRPGWQPIQIPPYMDFVDNWAGYVPAEGDLAMIVGDDLLPDVMIGRIAANTAEEAAAYVDKAEAYIQSSWEHAWRWGLFAADNPDSGGDFHALSQDLIESEVPGAIQTQRVWLGTEPYTPVNSTSAGLAEAAIAEAINDGVSFVTWHGHGAIDRWANEGVWRSTSVDLLNNNTHWPVVTTFNCLDGYFANPVVASIAEAMTMAAGRGSIANFSPSGLALAYVNQYLAKGFYRAVFQGQARTLGEATLFARALLYSTVGSDPLLHTATLFGDPALRVSYERIQYLPVMLR